MEPALSAGSCVASANLHPEPSPLAGFFLWRSFSVDSLQLMARALLGIAIQKSMASGDCRA
jgi:hypothetical protein